MLGHAYRHLATEQHREALAAFEVVVHRTGALEAVVGAIDLRLHMGESPASIEARLNHGKDANSPVTCFIKAYLDAHSLPELDGEAHAETVRNAREHLNTAWSELKNQGPARALYGAIMHEEYLHTGTRASAEIANFHYMLALELERQDPRYSAMVIGQLGLLHSQVGNYRIALSYFEQRQKLPFTGDAEEFAVHLAHAQTLLHVDRAKDAAKIAEAALALSAHLPELTPFRALVLDRTALYHLAAGQFERALVLYDLEIPLLAKDESTVARRNHFVVRLARAAAALGAGRPRRALEDIAALESSLGDERLIAALTFEHQTTEEVGRSYRAIAAGLHANANLAIGQLDPAATALLRQRATLLDRFAKSDRDQDVRELTLIEARLSANARERRDLTAAAKWFSTALDRADNLAARTHAEVDVDQLRVLWLGATLQTLDHAPVTVDLTKRLTLAQDKLVKLGNPDYGVYKRWFEIYLGLMKPGATASVVPASR
jgi:cellulose synthase operon protein C